MQTENSVCVHVRRGDYAAARSYHSFFGLLPKEYYEKAIAKIKNEADGPTFYFFSDDPAWCRATFTGLKAEFIDHNAGEQAHKDMVLMSSCRHNIIANSSFSWWGAWLNNNPEKIVAAPASWFKSNRVNSDLLPQSWYTF